MRDRIGVAVSDMARSLAFCDRALAPLPGVARVLAFPEAGPPAGVGYGRDGKPWVWVWVRVRAAGAAFGPIQIAFAAPDRPAIDAFHAAALAAGGTDTGAPGLRPERRPDDCAAFVLDPDGDTVEAARHAPGGARPPCRGGGWGVYAAARGWRGQAPRQPGQVRKEAAVTSPAWVVVQPLAPPLSFREIVRG